MSELVEYFQLCFNCHDVLVVDHVDVAACNLGLLLLPRDLLFKCPNSRIQQLELFRLDSRICEPLECMQTFLLN